MTDVLDRLEPDVRNEPISLPYAPPSRRKQMSVGALGVAAALSIGAGVIHLVMVPSHAGESLAEGVGFALAGWFQILSAWWLYTRRHRALLMPIAVANLVFIGAWAYSRTLGIPFGAHAGQAESAGFVDLTTVALEAALVLACIFLAVQTARRPGRGWLATALVLGVAGITTAAIASPSARDHASHSHDDGHATVDDKG